MTNEENRFPDGALPWKPVDTDWADTVRFKLVLAGFTQEHVHEALETAYHAVEVSGLAANEALGDPDEYAEQVISEELTVEEELEESGEASSVRHWLLNSSLAVILATGYLLFLMAKDHQKGEPFNFTVGMLGLLVAIAVLLGTVSFGYGMLKMAKPVLATASAAVGVAVTTFLIVQLATNSELKSQVLVADFSRWWLLVAWIALIVFMRILFKIFPAKGEEAQQDPTDEEWFDKLESVLRWRYLVRKNAVKREVASAWQEFADAKADNYRLTAAEYHGTVDNYAFSVKKALATNETKKPFLMLVFYSFLFLGMGVAGVISLFADGFSWQSAITAVIGLSFLLGIISSIKQLRAPIR